MNSNKIAIKVLTASDLSFFKVHLQLSKQKAINLNSDIFIDRFYPGLKGAQEPVVFPFTVIGPGGKAPHQLTRKALRSPGAKNWRLNGEFIHDPDGEPGRYDGLAPNDFAVMTFEGSVQPKAVTLVLVSASGDNKLRAAIASIFEFTGRNTMVEVSGAIIADLRAATIDAYAAGAHPFDALVLHDTLEEVLFDDTSPTPAGTVSSGRSVTMSPQDLHRQLLAAEEIGQLGEELFGSWLSARGHGEDDFEWVSLTHARSAFDYEVHTARWLENAPHVLVDVKTTRGPFERPVHMSIAELRFAAKRNDYRIARLYGIGSPTPRVRILTGVQPLAESIVASLGALPAGVVADSVQIKPDAFVVELDEELQ